MKVLNDIEAAQTIARAKKKPVIFISTFGDYCEIMKAAPYLKIPPHGQIILDGHGFIVCETVKEQETLYWQTVGDDGPTKTNPYKGPARVYALTIDAKGRTRNENT